MRESTKHGLRHSLERLCHVFLLAIPFIVAGCGDMVSGEQPKSTSSLSAPTMTPAANKPASQSPAPAVADKPAVQTPTPLGRPTFGASSRRPDVTYSVLLRVFTEPDHPAVAARWRDSLVSNLGWKELSVVMRGDFSMLYWGQFSSMDSANRQLAKAKAYRNQKNVAIFSTAAVTVLPGSDTEQAEWDLSKCPGKYSLLVADFQDVPQEGYVERLEDAVAYCRELRAKGYEAYYHHGPSTSSVTIGSFGPESIQEPDPRQGARSFDAPTISQAVVVGPELLALQKQFPHRLWNLREIKDTLRDSQGHVVSQTVPSSLPIAVPHERSGFGANSDTRGAAAGSASGSPAGWQRPAPQNTSPSATPRVR